MFGIIADLLTYVSNLNTTHLQSYSYLHSE